MLVASKSYLLFQYKWKHLYLNKIRSLYSSNRTLHLNNKISNAHFAYLMKIIFGVTKKTNNSNFYIKIVWFKNDICKFIHSWEFDWLILKY